MKAPTSETRYANHMAALDGDDLHVTFFGWPRALFGRYNVFHLHWPERFVSDRDGVLGFASRARSWALVTRLRLFRTPIVRTLHNLEPHDDSTAASIRYARIAGAFDRLTRVDIQLVPEPDLTRPQPRVHIPHGHYRRPFSGYAGSEPVRGRLLFFGLIKRYKGVDDLIEAFSLVEDDDVSLRIVGKPADDTLAATITEARAHDVRVSSQLAFVSDKDLVAEVTAASLVVLPYRELHSSGAVLVALSLGRPVLIPDSPTSRDLQVEAGSEWVHTFQPPLSAERMLDAVRAVEHLPAEAPTLADRDWDVIRARHHDVYRKVVGPPSVDPHGDSS